MWWPKKHWGSVVYDIALGECGVRYCAGAAWCTVMPLWIVVYDYTMNAQIVINYYRNSKSYFNQQHTFKYMYKSIVKYVFTFFLLCVCSKYNLWIKLIQFFVLYCQFEFLDFVCCLLLLINSNCFKICVVWNNL